MEILDGGGGFCLGDVLFVNIPGQYRDRYELRSKAVKDITIILFALTVMGLLAAGMVGQEVQEELQFPCGSADE